MSLSYYFSALCLLRSAKRTHERGESKSVGILNCSPCSRDWRRLAPVEKLQDTHLSRVCTVGPKIITQISVQGQKRYPKELLRQRFCRTFGRTFRRFASKPLCYWVVPSNYSEISLVLFARFFGFGVLLWPLICDLGINFQIAQDICYTGLYGRNSLV